MVKVTGNTKTPSSPASGSSSSAGRSAKASGVTATGGFRVGAAVSGGPMAGSAAASTTSASSAGEAASASALGALIALQGEGGSRAKNRARAERLLLLLERLRDGLLSGRLMIADLEAIRDAASAKLDCPDPAIAALYADISLRARVELAKIGR